MARIEIKKGSIDWDIHQEFWDLHKEYGDPEETADYWNALNDAITGWTRKYKGTDYEEMTVKMAAGLLTTLDKKSRRCL